MFRGDIYKKWPRMWRRKVDRSERLKVAKLRKSADKSIDPVKNVICSIAVFTVMLMSLQVAPLICTASLSEFITGKEAG